MKGQVVLPALLVVVHPRVAPEVLSHDGMTIDSVCRQVVEVNGGPALNVVGSSANAPALTVVTKNIAFLSL